MDENNVTTTENAVTQPTAATQPVITQPQAVNVDMTVIEQKAQERAERAAQAAVRNMLEQAGFGGSELKSMLDEYKAKQVTPEQTIQQLTSERDSGFATRDAEIATLKQEKILRGYGFTDDEEVTVYGIRINQLVTTEKDFATAAKEYFEANPRPTKPPASLKFNGSGHQPMTATEEDALAVQYKQAVKDRNTAEMSRLTRLSAEKGIILKG